MAIDFRKAPVSRKPPVSKMVTFRVSEEDRAHMDRATEELGLPVVADLIRTSLSVLSIVREHLPEGADPVEATRAVFGKLSKRDVAKAINDHRHNRP